MKKRNYILIILFPLIYSCGTETPITQAERIAASQARINMDMDDNLLLTISAHNFQQSLSLLGFRLEYDIEKLTRTTNVMEGGNIVFSSDSYENIEEAYLSIIFSNITGSEQLIELQFDGDPSNYKGVIISFKDISLIDANNIPWDHAADGQSFYPQSVCYIDEGVVIHATQNTSEPIEDWESTGNYIWTNDFCQYY